MGATSLLHKLPTLLLALACASSPSLLTAADSHNTTIPVAYKADITEIAGTNSGVSGTVTVFASNDGTTVGYGGYLKGLQSNLVATSDACTTAKNGCGVHIHSGTGCEDSDAQGGHYFVDPVTVDPWVDARYTSDADGKVVFSDMRVIGTTDLAGRAFVVHAADGSRIGCGILERVTEEDASLPTDLTAINDQETKGSMNAIVIDDGTICYFGSAAELEANLKSSALTSTATGGTDCTATNGCGTHVHAGTDCATTETQMGHYWNDSTLSSDPWATVGYLSTSDVGFAHYVGCVMTGHTEYKGRAFIVHANDGSRVACGLLGDHGHGDDDKSGAAVRGYSMLMIVFIAGGVMTLFM